MRRCALEGSLVTPPNAAPVMEGTGGLRKLRYVPPSQRRGRSGAYRVIYAYFPGYGAVALFAAFGKNEQSELSRAEAREIAKALRAFESELRKQSGPRN